jgi:uncharacterized glyoxalase superfamily protein PhnB
VSERIVKKLAVVMSESASARGRPARLSRDALVDAAEAIVAREGIEALTMRRLADDLGSSPMGLYRHVRGVLVRKEEETMSYRTPDAIPGIYYDDARAAIDWLERAFGFERHAVYEDGGVVRHAEMRVGNNGMIMLGTTRENPYGLTTPREAGGLTGSVYVIVEDPDAHHDRAVAAGAEIVQELLDTDYGSRDYSARDPDGYVWHFGTYRPAS